MKHIEFSSEPWNPLPSKYGTLFESAGAVLKSSLGSRWVVSLFAILLVVALPIPIFYFLNEVRFDSALFVTEWLKLLIEGIIFFFVLEIVRHRSLSFTSRQLLLSFVATNYVIPLQGMLEALRYFHESVLENTSFEDLSTITTVRHHWSVVKSALSSNAVANLPMGGELIVWLHNNSSALDVLRCDAIVTSLSSVHSEDNLNQSEFEELFEKLNNFLHSTNRLFSSS